MLGYDAKGNLTSGNLDGSGVWAFGYDAENRLTSACKPAVSGVCASPTVNATYAYDPLGRRVHKSGAGVTERYFLDDGDDEIAEYDGGKNPVAAYVPGPAIDEPIARVTGFGATLTHAYFHANHQGSVIAMSDDTGAKVEGPFLYDPYGACFEGSTPCGSLASSVPFKFTGRYLDAETGLYYYRARCYSPTLGRFCQTDPVGYTADLNLYTYVGNDPTNRVDPTGMVTTCTGSGANQQCTTTSDTFNAAHSNGQTTLPTATMQNAANAGAGAMASPGPNAQPNQESAGVLHWNSPDNSTTVRPESGAQSGSTATGDTTTVTFHGPADVAGIHGHIDSGSKASNGMVDDPEKSNKNYGDTASLSLKNPRPMATVSHGQVGWHGIDNGRLQFTFPQGAMTPGQIQQMQQNLNLEQQNFQTQ